MRRKSVYHFLGPMVPLEMLIIAAYQINYHSYNAVELFAPLFLTVLAIGLMEIGHRLKD